MSLIPKPPIDFISKINYSKLFKYSKIPKISLSKKLD